jgi:RHS repeat-associated protein
VFDVTGIDQILMLEQADVLDQDTDSNTTEITRSYYHRNALESVMEISTASQTEAASYRYTPYGEVTITRGGTVQSSDPLGQSWGYTARFQDQETSLVYFRSRYADGTRGCFLGRDSTGYHSGPNLFQFANSNPVRFRDPKGTDGVAAPPAPVAPPPTRAPTAPAPHPAPTTPHPGIPGETAPGLPDRAFGDDLGEALETLGKSLAAKLALLLKLMTSEEFGRGTPMPSGDVAGRCQCEVSVTYDVMQPMTYHGVTTPEPVPTDFYAVVDFGACVANRIADHVVCKKKCDAFVQTVNDALLLAVRTGYPFYFPQPSDGSADWRDADGQCVPPSGPPTPVGVAGPSPATVVKAGCWETR